MCRIGLPSPFHKIKSRGHHAFLEVIQLSFNVMESLLGAFPVPSLVSLIFARVSGACWDI